MAAAAAVAVAVAAATTTPLGAGGEISTGKYVSVRAGDSAGFTFTPNTGYQIADVLVNGKSVGAVKSYTFTNVHSNQTIHVTFKAAAHTNPQTGVCFDDAAIPTRFNTLYSEN